MKKKIIHKRFKNKIDRLSSRKMKSHKRKPSSSKLEYLPGLETEDRKRGFTTKSPESKTGLQRIPELNASSFEFSGRKLRKKKRLINDRDSLLKLLNEIVDVEEGNVKSKIKLEKEKEEHLKLRKSQSEEMKKMRKKKFKELFSKVKKDKKSNLANSFNQPKLMKRERNSVGHGKIEKSTTEAEAQRSSKAHMKKKRVRFAMDLETKG